MTSVDWPSSPNWGLLNLPICSPPKEAEILSLAIFCQMPTVCRGIMFRSCLGVYHPDCHLVDMAKTTTHEETRIELRALVPLKLLGTDSDIVIARSTAGFPANVLWAGCTDL